jgi:hypothetical protein
METSTPAPGRVGCPSCYTHGCPMINHQGVVCWRRLVAAGGSCLTQDVTLTAAKPSSRGTPCRPRGRWAAAKASAPKCERQSDVRGAVQPPTIGPEAGVLAGVRRDRVRRRRAVLNSALQDLSLRRSTRPNLTSSPRMHHAWRGGIFTISTTVTQVRGCGIASEDNPSNKSPSLL